MRRCLGLALALVLVAMTAAPAHATFPGRNGWIAIGYGYAWKYPEDPYQYVIRAVNPRTGKKITLLDCGQGWEAAPDPAARCVAEWPAWSPDGRSLAFADRTQRYGDSPGLGFLVPGRPGFERVRVSAAVGRLAWSPGGDRLAVDMRDPGARSDEPSSTLATVSRSGGAVTPLGTGISWGPDWSSRGELAYSAGGVNCINSEHPVCGIYTLRPGRSPRLAVRTGYGPSWSPDGKQLAYTRATGGRWGEQVMLVRPGKRPRALTRKGGFDPVWSPDG